MENPVDKMIAYCGLVCTDCPAYIATQADDRAALERVAAQWQEEYSAPDITVESVICDACMVESERHCGHWYECDIRACGVTLDDRIAWCSGTVRLLQQVAELLRLHCNASRLTCTIFVFAALL